MIIKKFSGKKGVALPEYALIGVLFAFVVGIAIHQLAPDLLRNFFVRSMDAGASLTGGKLQMRSMGE